MIVILKIPTNLRTSMQGRSYLEYESHYQAGTILFGLGCKVKREHDKHAFDVYVAFDGQLCYVYSGVENFPGLFEVIK